MTATLTSIRSYLIPPAGSYWKWSDDGEAIVYSDGRTIVFRAELEAVLRRLVSQGLPPLGPIVLLLAACRDSWKDHADTMRSLHQVVVQFQALSSEPLVTTSGEHAWVDEAIAALTRIHNWPPDIRGNLLARVELAASVFESGRSVTTPEDAGEIVAALADGISSELLIAADPPQSARKRILDDLRFLGAGLQRVDADGLRLRLETGLEQHVVPADVDEPLAKTVRKLFTRLQHDEELAGMIRLARDLMAVVHLPRPLDHFDDMPVGGVSDISNRGTLDRLLISELAQDDETLMLRVAMNEAMYLRRETPPYNPQRSRIVVLDAGLRMWGVPRVFATSVALSLAALSDPSVRLHVFRTEGDHLQPIDLATRDGLIEHLKQLQPEAHPGRALMELRRCAEGDEVESDTILITEEDVLEDREFQRALAASDAGIAFAMTVSRTGRFRLLQRTLHGTKMLREAQLDLGKLLEPPRRPVLPLIDPERSRDLPAICRLADFPLRLSHHVNPRQSWWLRHAGVLSITNDRRLMHWDKPLRGARQIADGLPSRKLLWCSPTPAANGTFPFVIGDPGKPALMLAHADLETGRCDLLPLQATESPVLTVCDHAGVLFVIYKRHLEAFDMTTGDRVHAATIPVHTDWVHDRYFRGSNSWQALAYDGTAPRFEEVLTYAQYAGFWSVSKIFDVEGVQGPVAMANWDGSLYFTADRRQLALQRPLRAPIQIVAIARNGSRVVARHGRADGPFGVESVLIDTRDGSVHRLVGDPHQAVETSFRQVVRPRNYRHRFQAVGIRGWSILLQTGTGSEVQLDFDLTRGSFQLIPASPYDERVEKQPFRDDVPRPRPVKRGLKVATFGNGNQVFLDSRGLLHLKSANPSLPEVTFVLTDDHEGIACWCSNGKMSGPAYYLGSDPGVAGSDVFHQVLVPFFHQFA